MSRKCVVPNCKNPTSTGIRFPQEENLKRTWLESLQIPDFQPTQTSFVCLNHFDKSNDDGNLEDVLQTCPIPTVSQDKRDDNYQNSAKTASSTQENVVICRLCMNSRNIVGSVFDFWKEEKIALSLAITRCIPTIKISKHDQLSKRLCYSCMEIIKLFYTFRKTCIRMDLQQRYRPLIANIEKRKPDNADHSKIAHKVRITSDRSQRPIVLPKESVSPQKPLIHSEKIVKVETQVAQNGEDEQNIVKKKFNEVKFHLMKALEGKLTEELEDAENIILEVHDEDRPPQVENLTPKSLTFLSSVCTPSNIVNVGGEQIVKLPKSIQVGVQGKLRSRTGMFSLDCLEEQYGLKFCIVDNYVMEYRLFRNGFRQLKCLTPRCPASGEQQMIKNVFANIVLIKTAHNHPYLSETERKKQIYLEIMRRKMQNEKSLNFKEIYEELGKKDPEIGQLLPMKDVLNQICSQQIKPSWPSVKSFDEFFDRIETDEFRDLHFTHSNKQFYQEKLTSSDGQSKAVIFANADTIEKLSNSEIMYVDSSFRIGANKEEINYHLLTILVWHDDSYFPILFALINKKSQAIYKEIFIHLRDTLAPDLRPKDIVTDYEANLYYALAEIYSDAHVGGSVFYYTQNIYKKISSMNLSHELETNLCFRNIYHMILMLPLLPLNTIHDGLANIESQACQLELEELMRPIFEYVRTEWLEKVTPELFCVHRIENRINENVIAPFKKLRDFLLLTKSKGSQKHSLTIGTVVDKIIELEDFLQQIYAAPSKKSFARDLSSSQKKNVIRAWQFIESHPSINMNQFFAKVVGYVKCMENQLWIWGFYRYTGSADDELIDVANFAIVSTTRLSEDSAEDQHQTIVDEQMNSTESPSEVAGSNEETVQSEPQQMLEITKAASSEDENFLESPPTNNDEVVQSNFKIRAVNNEGQPVVVNVIIDQQDECLVEDRSDIASAEVFHIQDLSDAYI